MLTVGAIAVGLSALIFLWSFNDGLHRNMLQNFQDAIIGSIQIHHEGFFERPELSRHLRNPDKIITTVEQAGVKRWSRRLEAFALAASDETTEGVMLIGMEADREPVITDLGKRISIGRFLREDDEYACILGATTARNLKLGLGDPVVMIGYDRFGALVAEEFTLVGIITSGEMGLDRGMALTNIKSLQEMLDMPDGVTDIVLRTPEDRIQQLTDELIFALSDENVEVMPWSTMFPVMHEWIILHDGFLYLFLAVVLFIVLAGELNTMLLSMLERTREFGIFMAIGTERYEIGLMLVFEALFIGLAGTLLGIVFGTGIVLVTHSTGIDLSILLGSTSRFYVDSLVYPHLNLDHLGTTVGAILIASIIAGLYPAWKASRLQPVEAMRNV
ncbi:MAG: ABC transporter permease [endosymbiont of Escarpia spicata]|uniref:ABC transporter permease n=1 Tax=endosymbiont of Escarpia spicata TaxID=2200908 RepID=A0A370DET8_9GAMM|nr:MAG: ABC transporter permease [endosymbiont of Escarpia spicata]